MKKLLFLSMAFLLIGVSGRISAQPNWHVLYSDVQNKSIDYTFNDEYLLCGQVQPPMIAGWSNMVPWGTSSRPLSRIQLQLLNNALNSNWFKTYVADDELQLLASGVCNALSTEFYVEYAKQVSNGDYIICGSVRRDGETGGCGSVSYNHVFLMRVDPMGMVLWYKRYNFNAGGVGYAHLYSIEETPTGFIVCGERYTGPDEGLILKVDGNGGFQWCKLVTVPAYWDPTILLPTQYTQVIKYGSDFALIGFGNHSLTMFNILVTLIADNGTILQNVNYDDTHHGITLLPNSICVTDDNKLGISGVGGAPCTQGGHLMVMKVDPATMNVDFLKLYGANLNDPNYYAKGISIKCVNNILCVAGYDYAPIYPGGGLYAEIDNPTGTLNRYAVFDPNFYRTGCFVTVNTNLAAPVVSGYTNRIFETFVLLNQYNIDCHANDKSCSDRNIGWAPRVPVDINYTPIEIPDIAYAFDLNNLETIVCQPPPKMRGRDEADDMQKQMDYAVNLYPSLAHTTITLHGTRGQPLHYDILSISGLNMLTGEIVSGETINVASLATGMYLVRVRTADGGIHTLKFVKE